MATGANAHTAPNPTLVESVIWSIATDGTLSCTFTNADGTQISAATAFANLGATNFTVITGDLTLLSDFYNNVQPINLYYAEEAINPLGRLLCWSTLELQLCCKTQRQGSDLCFRV